MLSDIAAPPADQDDPLADPPTPPPAAPPADPEPAAPAGAPEEEWDVPPANPPAGEPEVPADLPEEPNEEDDAAAGAPDVPPVPAEEPTGEPAPPTQPEGVHDDGSPIEPETADKPGETVTPAPGTPAPAVSPGTPPNETGDQDDDEPAGPAEKKNTSIREYALLEGSRLRDILAAEIKLAGGTLTQAKLDELIEKEREHYRVRLFRPIPTVEAINPTNAIRALHKREAGQGVRTVHLGVFPLHYWNPRSYKVGTSTSVSVDVVEDDD